MNNMDPKILESALRKQEKLERKKSEIAASTLRAIQELGYAKTSLRDIASVSNLALSSLHYYFEDKTDLICFCVKAYKSKFVSKLEEVMEASDSHDQLAESFCQVLARSVSEDASTHKLWYDIRVQAMFDERFRETVHEFDDKLASAIAKLLAKLNKNAEPRLAYALFDGVFFRYVCDNEAGNIASRSEIASTFLAILNALPDGQI